MAGLIHGTDPHRATVTGHATNNVALMAIAAAANQKVRVRFGIYGRGSASDPSVLFTVRRSSDLSGSTTSDLTAVKSSETDAETPQAKCKKFTVQPSNKAADNGSIIAGAGFTCKPSERGFTKTVTVNGGTIGQTVVLWGHTTTSCDVDIIPELEE